MQAYPPSHFRPLSLTARSAHKHTHIVIYTRITNADTEAYRTIT